jgi:4-hydroxybenzoate polyprenyltransferase
MLGWSAVAGIVDWSIVTPMYFGGIAWGIMYDLIYAHQVRTFTETRSSATHADTVVGQKRRCPSWCQVYGTPIPR